jgi:hypothetical protein
MFIHILRKYFIILYYKMLVTIASNSDNDASQFVNYFPEGLIIPKNAKIGVVNCSYVLHEGYIVDGTNNTFQLRLANMAAFGTITVTQGLYQTADDLADAIQSALQTWIGTQSAEVQNAFPAAQQTVSANQQGNEITIHLTFASDGTDQVLLQTTGDDTNAYIKDDTRCKGDDGQFINLSDLPSANDNYVATGDGGANHYWLSALSKVGQNFFARASASPQRNDCRTDLLLVHREDLDKSNAPINVAFQGVGTVAIYEMVMGVKTQINAGNPPAYSAGDTVEIRIPAFNSATINPQTVNGEYFLTSGGSTTEIAVDAGVGRYPISVSDEFLVKYEFEHASTLGQLPSKDDAVALNDAVLASSIDNGGGSYLAGDILTQSSSTGAGIGVQLQITQVGGMGAVQAYSLISTGEGHAPNDILEFTGGNGGAFRLQVDTVQDNYAVTALGATYATGTGIALTGGSGTGATCAITSVDGSGGITGLTITDPGDGYAANDILTVSGGDGNAQVTIGQVVNTLNWVKDLKANLVENPPNQRPLVVYDGISARMQTLASLINCKDRYGPTSGTLDINSESEMQTNNRTASNLHIQLDSVGGGIESREFGVNGKTVAVVPLGDNSNAHAGLFNNELFNIIYHNLKNPEPLQNNELAVRLTDYKNNIIKSLFHPVTITFDIRPELE